MGDHALGAVGEICEDVYLPEGVGRPGGIAANFAFHAACAGAKAMLVAAVGDDEAGQRLAGGLAAAPVDASRVRRLPGRSTTQRLRVEAGERVFCGYDPGVAASLRLDEADLRALGGCALIACSDGLPELLAKCLEIGPRVVCDFSRDTDGNRPGCPHEWLAPWVDRLAIAFIGGDSSFVEPLVVVSRRTSGLLVLTAGADGSFAFLGGRRLHQPALPVALVDTNGCGDAFQGAFAAAWAGGAPLERCLLTGAQRAAVVASAYGAQSR